jgi:peptidyl-prolyl cis-trans isomerase-like 1
MFKIMIILLLLSSCKENENIDKDTQSNVNAKDSLETSNVDLEKNRYTGPKGLYKGKIFSKRVFATIHTNYGKMEFELFPEISPLAVENFIYLAKRGYYENNQFFRVIESFIVQTGDSTNTGTGNLGYFFPTEVSEDLVHDRLGVLSFANYDTETNGTQFFITLSAQTSLNGKHPAFGYIVSGQEVLKKIGSVNTDRSNRPLEKIYIEKIDIIGL